MPWKFLSVLSIATAVGLLTLNSQHETTVELRHEIVRMRESKNELVQPMAENQRLKAVQISALELKHLNDDEVVAVRLRREAEVGNETMQARMKNFNFSSVLTPPAWSDVGTATPSAAVETTLWAAAGGDIDRLVDLMVFTPEAQAKAADLYAGLSATARAGYASPGHLIANFTTRDVPLTPVSFTGFNGGTDKAGVDIHFMDEVGNPTMKQIRLNMIHSSTGWRLTVPVSAVEKYRAMLKAAELPAGGGK